MGQTMREFANEYLGNWYLPDLKITDLIEIIIVAFLLYHVMVWIKNTKAWMLLKGISVLVVFILLATIDCDNPNFSRCSLSISPHFIINLSFIFIL